MPNALILFDLFGKNGLNLNERQQNNNKKLSMQLRLEGAMNILKFQIYEETCWILNY